MSRAFTKEIDDAPPAPIADRPISGAPNLVTPRGAAVIEARIDALTAALGNTLEPGEMAALRREQRYWLARSASMQIVPPATAPSTVAFGTTVEITRSGKTSRIRIVGEDEADPGSGKIAWTSPLARALDGATRGEIVELKAGGRTDAVKVVGISA